jgi:hypothetical protein
MCISFLPEDEPNFIFQNVVIFKTILRTSLNGRWIKSKTNKAVILPNTTELGSNFRLHFFLTEICAACFHFNVWSLDFYV